MPSKKRSGWLRLAVLAAIVVGTVGVAYARGWLHPDRLVALASSLRSGRDIRGASILFVALYAAAIAAGIPSTPFDLAGGAIFGFTIGFLLGWIGKVAGSAGGYWLARTLGKDAVRWMLRSHAGKLEELQHTGGFMLMLRLQLFPFLPLSVTNFAAGVAKANFGAFLLATALGTIPGTAVYTYFADSLLSQVAGAQHRAMVRMVGASVVVLLLSFAPLLAHHRRKRAR